MASDENSRLFLPLLCVISILLLVPLFVIDILPLHDYPNHLARMHVIRDLGESPMLQRYYEIQWEILPNLAMDILVPPLAQLVPLELAGKLFCAVILLSTVPAVAALHWALHGKVSLWPLAASLFVYNYVFMFGFLNYLAGVNLALAGVALWVRLRNLPPRWSLLLFTGYSTLLFFTHLYALGVYGVIVAGYELSRLHEKEAGQADSWRGVWLVAAGQFLLPLGLFVFASPTFGRNLSSVAASSVWSKIGALYSVFNSGDPSKDGYFFLIAVAGLITVSVTGWARLDRRLRLSVLLLAACFLVMPGSLFGSGYADYRLPWAVLLLGIAGSKWTLSGRRANGVFLALLLGILVARIGQITLAWHSFDEQYSQIESAIEKIPRGSKVFAYLLQGEEQNPSYRPPLSHIVTLAVIRCDAFVPTLYAFPGKHPVRLKPAYRLLKDRTPRPKQDAGIFKTRSHSPGYPLGQKVAGRYDYLFVFSRRGVASDMPPFYTLVAAGKHFELFRIQAFAQESRAPERKPKPYSQTA